MQSGPNGSRPNPPGPNFWKSHAPNFWKFGSQKSQRDGGVISSEQFKTLGTLVPTRKHLVSNKTLPYQIPPCLFPFQLLFGYSLLLDRVFSISLLISLLCLIRKAKSRKKGRNRSFFWSQSGQWFFLFVFSFLVIFFSVSHVLKLRCTHLWVLVSLYRINYLWFLESLLIGNTRSPSCPLCCFPLCTNPSNRKWWTETLFVVFWNAHLHFSAKLKPLSLVWIFPS